MLKCTNSQAATIIREVAEGGVEQEWEAGIEKILAACDAEPSKQFPMDALFLSGLSGLPLDVCDMITNAISMS